MIVWSKNFPTLEKLAGYLRLKRAEAGFFERIGIGRDKKTGKFGIIRVPGYHEKIAALAGKHRGRRCFVLGNGPSLSKMDLRCLKDEITIGSNGIYRMFDKMGFKTTYLTMEDMAQVEDRRKELRDVRGVTRLFALYNAYCIPPREDTLFMNVERDSYPFNKRWSAFYPQFSVDCASVVYLGSTITYINLQLAFFLGCDPVYLIGVDHDYGDITDELLPGKVDITPEILEKIQRAHFARDYHKIGGTFGVPYVEEQEKAYRKALEVYRAYGRSARDASYGARA